MQIIRDFSGAACLSSEREHILTDFVTSVRQGIGVCRLVPPLGFLHILTDRSGVTHKDGKQIGTLCRLSHYI